MVDTMTNLEEKSDMAADSDDVQTLWQYAMEIVTVKPAEARACAEKGLRIATDENDPDGQAQCLNALGVAMYHQRSYEIAQQYLNEALALAQKIHNKHEEASAYFNLSGLVHNQQGQSTSGIDYLRKAEAIWTELDDRRNLAHVYSALALYQLNLGIVDMALRNNQKALTLFQEFGDLRNIRVAQKTMASINHYQNDIKEALRYAHLSLETAEKRGYPIEIGRSRRLIANMLLEAGEIDTALTMMQETLAIFETIQSEPDIVTVQFDLGNVYFTRQQYEHAATCYRQALDKSKQLNMHRLHISCYVNLAETYLCLARFDAAKVALDQAREMLEKNEILAIKLEYLRILGEFYEKQQDYKTALRVWRQFHELERRLLNKRKVEYINRLKTAYEVQNKEKEAQILREKNAELQKEIAERSRVEGVLNQKNRFLNAIFEAIVDPLYVINVSDYSVEMTNDAARSLSRSSRPYCYALIHNLDAPCDHQNHVCPLRVMRDSKKAVTIEQERLDDDGNIRYVELRAYPVFDENGEFIQMIEQFFDVTARKHAEERFRLLTRAVEQTASVVVVTNRAGDIEFVNPAFTRITGYTVNEALGKNPRILKSDQHDPEFYQEMWDTLNQGLIWEGELINRKKNGELFWERTTISPVRNKDGHTTHYVAVKENITAQKKAEVALRQAKEAADKANQAKSTFLANMSHELRTPLNGILGYAEILAHDENATGKIQEGLRVIQQSGQHLLSLINDILDLARIEAGKLELNLSAVDLPNLVQEVRDIVGQRLVRKGLGFHTNFGADLPKMVQTDRKLLSQVLINLLGNAVKFTEAGAVTFSVQRSNKRIRFSVKDTGVGIDPEKLDKLFSPFEQVHETSHVEGTGLGLTISQQIIEMMGGRIQVASEIGQGSEFWFELRLPEVEGVVPIQPESVRRITGYKGTSRRVMVVEDRMDNREVLVYILQTLGFEIVEAENGFQAVDLVQDAASDLILMDYKMPDRDGFETTQLIRQMALADQPKIVMCSATVSEAVVQRSLEIGCEAFIAKPIQRKELLETLQKHLNLEWAYADSDSSAASREKIPPRDVLQKMLEFVDHGDVLAFRNFVAAKMEEPGPYEAFLKKNQELIMAFELKKIQELLSQYLR